MTAVLMLHASASSGAQWRSLAQALAPAPAVSPDLVGYGGNPLRIGLGEFRLGDEAVPLRKLIATLGAPVDLVGHSYGGAVALHLARTSPELVRTLVLIEPVAFHVLRGGDLHHLAGLREFTTVAHQVRKAWAEGDDATAGRLFIDYWTGEGAWARMPTERQAAVIASLPKLGHEIEAVLGEPIGAGDLREVRHRTLLIQGATTRLSARGVCDRLANALPDVELRVVPGAGHMLPLTHREQVNGLVAAHLRSIREKAA